MTYHDPGILRPQSELSWTGEVGNVDVRWQWDTDAAFGGNTNEVVSLEYENATAGSYDLDFNGTVSGTIQWDDNAAAIKAAIESAANVHEVNVTGTGTVADPFLVEFQDPINGGRNIPDMTVNSDSLTDDTVALAIDTQGVAGPPVDIVNLNDSTNNDEQVPDQDLGLTGPWYWRVAVVDRDDGLGSWSGAQELIYVDPIIYNRYLYHFANNGVAFDPTDEPAGGWGTGGTVGADGDVIDFNRYLYLLGNAGVGFTPTDDPGLGWGTGGTVGPDGDTIDPDRHLYLLANVDTTQPCPFMFSLSVAQAQTGDSITVKGQGLVSATSPTADAWDAEVRLYETPDFGAAFVTLSITDWTAGSVEDQIIATIPGGATSGFIAVVHTTTPSCPGSNFLGITIITLQPDRQAGWWAEIWDLRNVTKIISPVPFVHEASFESVANDQGSGEIILRGDDPDIDDIVDRSTNPEIQRLVKVYLHDRFAYSFIPDDSAEGYDEDGARTVRIYGRGQESILEWGRMLWKDFPAQPAKNRTWQYGSTENAVAWGDMESSNELTNGDLEDAQTDPWEAVGTAALFATSSEAHSGTYSLRVTPAALNDGVEVSFSQAEGDGVFTDVFSKVNLVGGTYLIAVLAEDDTVLDSFVWVPGSSAWLKTGLDYVAATAETVRLRITQTAGALTVFFIDDAIANTKIGGTFTTSRATARLSRTEVAAGVYSMEIAADAGGDSSFNGMQGFFSEASSQDYRLSVAVSGPAGKSVRFDARLGGVLVNATQVLTGAPTFDVITLEGTSGLTGGTGRFTIRSLDSGALTFYADELQILPGAAAANPGQIVIDVKAEMDLRGTLDFVTLNFDGVRDTAGVLWPEELPFEVDPSWTLWDLLEKFIGMGYSVELAPVNWREGGDTGWELNMWAPLNAGIDWSVIDDGPAILPGDTIRDVEPSSAPPAETVAYGEGSGGIWTVATASAARITNLERREAFVKADHAKDTVSLFRVVSHRLDTSLSKGVQWTAKLTDDADPLPYFDFINHDRLRAHLPDEEGLRDAVLDDTYLVAATTFRGTAGGITQEYEIDFGRYKLHAQRLRDLILARQIGRESSENYQKGTGSVSSKGAAAVASSSLAGTEAAGEVGAHPHLWLDIEPEIGGDLGGAFPDPSVVGLRGRALTSDAPADTEGYFYSTGLGQFVLATQNGNITKLVDDEADDRIVVETNGDITMLADDGATVILQWDETADGWLVGKFLDLQANTLFGVGLIQTDDGPDAGDVWRIDTKTSGDAWVLRQFDDSAAANIDRFEIIGRGTTITNEGDIIFRRMDGTELFRWDESSDRVQFSAGRGRIDFAGGSSALTSIERVASFAANITIEAESSGASAQDMTLRTDDAAGVMRTRIQLLGGDDLILFDGLGVQFARWDEGDGRFIFGGAVGIVLPVKTDTGDPSTPAEGQLYVNTSDNTVRVFADAAWRDLATW